MNSLREIVETSPQLRRLAAQGLPNEDVAEPLAPARWDWSQVKRVLVVRLRSIGDTVLTTPTLYALRRFLPNVQLDILLEDWVAPVLEGYPHVDHIIKVAPRSATSRARVARQLRSNRYDVVYNLHGGTTATFLSRATGAKHRVGYAQYRYARLHQHRAPSAATLWGKRKTHSVEQQLALAGWTGVPVSDRPATELAVTAEASASVCTRLSQLGVKENSDFALIHPAAAFATKQWPVERFAKVVDVLFECGLTSVAITTRREIELAAVLKRSSRAPLVVFDDLSLPELTSLASQARLFVGNDSGVAHIASAVGVPSVVIFGSSNVDHWQPWAKVPAQIVREELECQPCHGYFCEKFQQPECILRVPVEKVLSAVQRVLREST
ncbi:MAG TPA: glycosyltransferase family 9 protein [Pyrinomonadaceae bacterium]|nr:glycosyltransferase family 9 protein [Pyrinomonadaceae bacterium]